MEKTLTDRKLFTRTISIEYLHSFLSGNGAKFSNDTLRDVIPQIRNYNRRMRDEAMRDMGLKRVRGALGGVYWESAPR